MGFVRSAINQVGRDLGKVVSNQVFKDAHSTPQRIIGGVIQNRPARVKKSMFDKNMEIDLSSRSSTMIKKLNAGYVEMRKAFNEALEDGYMDSDEHLHLLNMCQVYNQSLLDVCEVLELNESKNKEDLGSLKILSDRINDLIHNSYRSAARGCEEQIELWKNLDSGLPSKSGFIAKYMFWMGKYAQDGKLRLLSTILMNFLDLGVFYITRPILAIIGYKKYNELSATIEDDRQYNLSYERQRLELYNRISSI